MGTPRSAKIAEADTQPTYLLTLSTAMGRLRIHKYYKYTNTYIGNTNIQVKEGEELKKPASQRYNENTH